MNGAQRAAFKELMRIGRQMSNACYTLGRRDTVDVTRWAHDRDTLRELQEQWDAAYNRYFELEAEAKKAKHPRRAGPVVRGNQK